MSSQAIPPISDEQVEYRPVPGFAGYRVGSDGSLWTQSIRGSQHRRMGKWRRLRGAFDGRYFSITLCSSERRKRLRIHQLVLELFVGPAPDVKPRQEARHLNDIKTDNRLENLVWGTSSDNKKDSLRNGIFPVGSKTAMAILDETKVLEIRRRLAAGSSCTSLSKEFGVSRPAISLIKSGKNWKHCKTGETENGCEVDQMA